MSRPIVMISHVDEEMYLAAAWQNLLANVLGLPRNKIWFSRDPGAVTDTTSFADDIMQKMRFSRAIISIQSPISRFRPWMLWEAGVAMALKKSFYPVVYQRPRDADGQDRIFTKLGTILDIREQYRGNDIEDVKGVLNRIVIAARCLIEVPRLSQELDAYMTTVKAKEHRWVFQEPTFDKRVQLVFDEKERASLAETGVISADVKVKAIKSSLTIFDLPEDTIAWGPLMLHLIHMKSPWSGSAARWARGLGAVLQRGLGASLIDEAEGLPLYFDPCTQRKYRPALTSRTDNGSETIFNISFASLPPELTAVPKTNAGILIHYIDFLRMMRWGVLEDSDTSEFFTAPHVWSEEEQQRKIANFLGKLLSIRTEFWNRGFQRGAIQSAIQEKDVPVLADLEKRYFALIKTLDPKDNGEIPNPLPEVDALKNTYRDLLQINKKYFEFVSRCLTFELRNLRES
jgi:hypothetical protein